ncbi:hypothetical protein ARSEF4850_005408 [Beauveria asiatica]
MVMPRDGAHGADQPGISQQLTLLAKSLLDSNNGKFPLSTSTRQRISAIALALSGTGPELRNASPNETQNCPATAEAIPPSVDGPLLPIETFTSSDCLTPKVSLEFCSLWMSQVLDQDQPATWRSWVPGHVQTLANSTPRLPSNDVLSMLNGRERDTRPAFEEVIRSTGFNPEHVLELSHYGYNHGWVENVIKGRVDNARDVAEDIIILLFAELATADTAFESTWYTCKLRKRAMVRLLQHFCGTIQRDIVPVVLCGACAGTRADRGAFFRGETVRLDLTRYFWLRFVDSGVLAFHIWANPAAVAEGHQHPVDLQQLAARDGMLANDLNDTVADATGTGLNYVLAAYANGYACAGVHISLIVRGGLVQSISHCLKTGDMQPLVATIMAHAIHLWGARYMTHDLLESLVPAAVDDPDSSSYIIDNSWPPRLDSDPEMGAGYAETLREYAGGTDAPMRRLDGAEAYYRLLHALHSDADPQSVEEACKSCLRYFAIAAEQGLDAVAWAAFSDLSVGAAISPSVCLPAEALLSVRNRYQVAYSQSLKGMEANFEINVGVLQKAAT